MLTEDLKKLDLEVRILKNQLQKNMLTSILAFNTLRGKTDYEDLHMLLEAISFLNTETQ